MKVVEPFLMVAWTVFEMFRRMNFPSDAIFFAISGNLDVVIELHWSGVAVAGIRVCGLDEHKMSSRDDLEARWLRFIHEDVPTMPEEVFEKAWEGSQAQARGGQILMQLALLGVTPPPKESTDVRE